MHCKNCSTAKMSKKGLNKSCSADPTLSVFLYLQTNPTVYLHTCIPRRNKNFGRCSL